MDRSFLSVLGLNSQPWDCLSKGITTRTHSHQETTILDYHDKTGHMSAVGRRPIR